MIVCAQSLLRMLLSSNITSAFYSMALISRLFADFGKNGEMFHLPLFSKLKTPSRVSVREIGDIEKIETPVALREKGRRF